MRRLPLFVTAAFMALAVSLVGAADAPAPGAKAAAAPRTAKDAKPAPAAGKKAKGKQSEIERLRDKLTDKVPGMRREDIRPTPVAGLYEIQRGHLFAYVSGDGKYLIQGDLIDIETGQELTEDRRRVARLAALKSFADFGMIEFGPPAPMKAKYWVTVFTDVDCGYCRKLHNDMAGYHQQGIGIRYLFFPRSGPNTPSFKTAEAVWCSADRKDALTRAKRGEKVEAKTACDNPILKEYQLAEELGVRGTPALILPNGDLQPGYLPPPMLAARLKESEVSGAPAKTAAQ